MNFNVFNPPPIQWLRAEEIYKLEDIFKEDEIIALDYETKGLPDEPNNRITLFSICGEHARVVVQVHFVDTKVYGEELVRFLRSKKHCWVYNCHFEIWVTKFFFGEWIYFDDAMTVMILEDSRGTLKENAVLKLGVPMWKEIIDDIRSSFTKLLALYRAGKTEAMTELMLYMEQLDPALDVNFVMDKVRGLDSGELSTFECIPYRILGEYCAKDAYYTLYLGLEYFTKHQDYYLAYQKQAWVAAVMEAFAGIGWVDEVAENHDQYYMEEASRALKEIILSSPVLVDAAVKVEFDKVVGKLLNEYLKSKLKENGLPNYKYVVEAFLNNNYSEQKVIDKLPPGINPHEFLVSVLGSPEDARAKIESENIDQKEIIKQHILADINRPDITVEQLKAYYNPSSPPSAPLFWEAMGQEFKDKLFVYYINFCSREFSVKIPEVITLENVEHYLAEFQNSNDYDIRRMLRSAIEFYEEHIISGKKEIIERTFECLKSFGLDIDDESTWDDSFRLLRNYRIFKKVLKSSSVCINGKVGRYSVSVYKQPEKLTDVQGPLRKYDRDPLNPGEIHLLRADFFHLAAETRRWRSGIHCLTGQTKVRLTDGSTVEASDLYLNGVSGETVYSVPEGKADIIEAPVKDVLLSGYVDELIEIELDNGQVIKCTPNHRFLLKDGSYKEAQDLGEEDELMEF